MELGTQKVHLDSIFAFFFFIINPKGNIANEGMKYDNLFLYTYYNQ